MTALRRLVKRAMFAATLGVAGAISFAQLHALPVAAAGGSDPYRTAVSSSKPLAYYPLDERSGTTATDASGHGYNAAIGRDVRIGTPSLLPCCTATSMTFSGTARTAASTVDAPAGAAFRATTGLTMEGVFSFATQPVTYAVLFGYGDDRIYAPYEMYFSSTGQIVAQVRVAAGAKTIATSPLKPNTAYHVAATYDGTTFAIYLNGTRRASRAVSGSLVGYDATHGLVISDDGGLIDPRFDGSVQHVAVYGRPLAANEVASHYAASGIGATPTPTSTPIVAPTATPTAAPSPTPTVVPTAKPTAGPTSKPTVAPTATPTTGPTSTPTAVPSATPLPTPAGPALADPPQLVSSGGSLTFNVTAQVDSATGNPTFWYNGARVPPTLHLVPGDTLYVHFNNNLPVPPAGSGYTNTSSLHYHGLHVSPQAPADDSIDMLAAPGQMLNYTVAIPTTQPGGLYWYHTHAHGEAERQTLAGMSGALVIEGIAGSVPQVAGLPEHVLVVRDAPLPGHALPAANRKQVLAMQWAMQHGVAMHGVAMPGGTSRMQAMGGLRARTEVHGRSNAATRNPYVTQVPRFRLRPQATSTDQHCVVGSPEARATALTVNGQTQPAIAIAPGETQFWRVVNAGADTYLDLAIDNAQLTVVAIDGVPLSQGINTPQTLTVNDYVLPPSSRVEFTVTGPAAGTQAYLRTQCFDSGSSGVAMPAQILASLYPYGSLGATHRTSAGHSLHVSSNGVSRAPRTAVMNESALRASSRQTMAGMSMRGMPMRGTAYAGRRRLSARAIMSTPVALTRTISYSDQNTIDGYAYDPAAPPRYYAQVGTAQDWTIVNASTQVHTFHIHQIHFVLEAINGVIKRSSMSWTTSTYRRTARCGCGWTSPIRRSSAHFCSTATSSRTRIRA